MLRIDLGIQGGSDISGATLKIKNGENDLFTNEFFVPDGEHIASTRGAESFIINNVNTAEDVYFALWPNDREDITLSFELTKGANTYTATLNPNRLEAGVYYTNGNSTNPGGVKVELEESEVDHSLNPLLKWAPGNLECSSSGTNSIGSETAHGSLYQWGRNYGYENYRDARGTYDKANALYYYAVCNAPSSAHCGIGYETWSENVYFQGTYWAMPNLVKPHTYTATTKTTKLGTTRYLMNATGSDYWIADGGGNDWYSRAEACGYTTTNPYPQSPDGKKWRLPKLEDFQEIFPRNNVGETDLSLTNIVNSVGGELRTRNDKSCNYVIRWICESNGLKIQALVVPSTFKEEDITSETWKDENVKELFFPFTGTINAYTSVFDVDGVGTDTLCRPHPEGTSTDEGKTKRLYSNNNQYYWDFTYTLTQNIVDHGINQLGRYWVSDVKGGCATFRDNSKQPSLGYKSALYIGTVEPQTACAIRCVLDETK